MYNFGLLDPRPIPAAEAANSKVLGPATLGVEVTIPALAARCGLGNIDPQHMGGDPNRAAIEVAWAGGSWDWPISPGPQSDWPGRAEGAPVTLVTVRPDLDSIGFMALMALRYAVFHQRCQPNCPGSEDYAPSWGDDGRIGERVRFIVESDKFSRGGWPGPRPLPTLENPWPEAASVRPLAAIAAAVADHKVPFANRVSAVACWLQVGEELAGYRGRVEAERLDLARALEEGRIKAEAVADGRIAAVVSEHRAATSIGYALAPAVVALNPRFKFQGGEPHVKFTVCQFTGGFVNLKAAAAELAGREAGWGGTPTIIGSPQGVGSTLALEEVVEVVRRHLLPAA